MATKPKRPTKNNIDYWAKRYRELENKTHESCQNYVSDLNAQFKEANKRIETQLSEFYRDFSDLENITYSEAKRLLNSDELKSFQMSVKEYEKKLKEYEAFHNRSILKQLEEAELKAKVTRLEAIILQLSCEASLVYNDVDEGMFELLYEVYLDRYYRSIFTIFQGFGIGVSFEKVDMKSLKLLLERPWVEDGYNFSDRIWRNRERLAEALRSELVQALISGDGYVETAERLAAKLGADLHNCVTIVATESAFFSSVAQLNSWKELELEQYKIVATLDEKTSEICRDMDGKKFDVSQFDIGNTAPPFHVNCRTTTAPYFDDTDVPGYVVGKRAARDSVTGETYYVPADMTYREWEKEYL